MTLDDNSDQVHFWNELAGPLWVAHQNETDRLTGPFGEQAIERAQPVDGDQVLDVGCGCGSTTRVLAAAVAPSGRAIGVDVSRVMLEQARHSAAAAGLTNLEFIEGDAQCDPFGNDRFDLVFSRFGTMFFADPVAAFFNLGASLRPGGRLTFVCWREPALNPWMTVPERAALRFFELDPPGAAQGPGPFALSAHDHVAGLLRAAGLAEVELVTVAREVLVVEGSEGPDLHRWAHHRLVAGPARVRYLESPTDVQARARADLIEAVSVHRSDDGVRMPGAAWLVSARR